MVKLFCAIVGVTGRAFPVDIDVGETVGDLKDAIKVKKANDLKYVDADKLQLFLAKKDGAWLPDDDTLDAMLQSGVDTSSFMEMRASWTIHDVLEESKMTGEYAPKSRQIHVLVVVPEQEHAQTGLWLVAGSVGNALDTKGIRCKLYWMATLRIGYYDPVRRIGNKNVAFWYEDKKLCLHVLFKTEDAALLFETDLRTGPQTLGSPLTNQVVETRVAAVTAMSTDLHRVFFGDYVPEDSESPQNTISSILLTTSVSNLDSSTDEFRFQRIEHEKFFLPYGKAESCHLVS